MDVRYSPEQDALRDAASNLASRLGPGTVRDLDDGDRAAKLDAAVESSGWRELRVAVEGSAPLASVIEAAIVAGELGVKVADTSFMGPVMASELRRLAGAEPSSERETIALAADLTVPAVAVDGQSLAPCVAFDAGRAASALVLRPVSGGHGLAILDVPPGGEGVDLTRSVVPLDAAAPLSSVPSDRTLTDDDIRSWTALGLALTCADLVGIMQGAVALATEYAASRRQYGAAVGSFQAVQHLLADAYVAMEGSRSVALHAAWAVDVLPPAEALSASSVAKAYCARAARSVCETVIQVHGGIGNTWECMAHVYLRRSLTSCDVLGGVGPSLARVLEHKGIGGSGELR